MLAPGNDLIGGTPGFAAPEVRQGPIDQRADIYSLGVTLYVALGGIHPTVGVALEELAGRNPAVTPELIAVLARATATRAADRFASAADLEQALSVPFSRIVPPFSPTMLARVVQRHSREYSLEEQMRESRTTLVSMSGTVSEAMLPPRPVEVSRIAGVLGPKLTRRVTPVHRRRFRLGTVGSIAVLGALAGGAFVWRARQHPHSAFATSTPLAPPPAAPAQIAPSRAASAQVVPPTAEAPSASTAPGPVPAAAANAPPAPAIPTSALATHTKHKVRVPAHKPHPARNERSELARAEQPDPATTAQATGFLTVSAYPWGAVLVDGKRIASQTPVYRAPVSVGRHVVTVVNPDRNAEAPPRTVDVRPGETTTLGFEW
jgi:serine/threonine-protein kinase